MRVTSLPCATCGVTHPELSKQRRREPMTASEAILAGMQEQDCASTAKRRGAAPYDEIAARLQP